MTFPAAPVAGPPGQLLPLYPMTVADVLDGAFRTWRAVIAVVTLAIVLVTGPIEILGHLLLYRSAPDLLLGPVTFDQTIDLATTALASLVSLASAVAGVYAAAIVLVAVHQADHGQRPSLGRAFTQAIRPSLVALVSLLLVALAAAGLAFAAVVLVLVTFGLAAIVVVPVGVIVGGAIAAASALCLPIAVVEARGPIATLSRAIWVLRVRFWRTVGITLLVLIVLVGVTAGVGLLLDVLALAAGPWAWVVLAVGQLLLSVLNVPIVSIAALLVFLDARMLHEGYDLEVRIDRLAAA